MCWFTTAPIRVHFQEGAACPAPSPAQRTPRRNTKISARKTSETSPAPVVRPRSRTGRAWRPLRTAPIPSPAGEPDSPRRAVRPTLPPPEPRKPATPTSGTLTYAGAPVGRNDEITFENLPPGTLHLTYDTKSWTHRVA